MDKALYDLETVIETAKDDLADVEFDTIVGTGFSGGVVIPALAMAMGKEFMLIRKEGDDSHHGPGRMIGALGARWLFVDDFVSSGRTRRRVLDKVAEAAMWEYHDTEFVGGYYYDNKVNRFEPAEGNEYDEEDEAA